MSDGLNYNKSNLMDGLQNIVQVHLYINNIYSKLVFTQHAHQASTKAMKIISFNFT